MRTTLAFIWHMHQPCYRDMATGESTMPWVRFHGIHSYYDMLRLYERFPQSRGTINFVASLVDQLYDYVEGGKSDDFLEHTLIPAENLNPAQKVFLLRYFFMANPDRKIAPYANYRKLYERRGLDPAHIDFQQAIRFFSTQDYLDLQVFYNLVWFGWAAKEEIPEIGQLLNRGGHYTEEDKAFVVEAQRRILRSLLEGLRRATQSANVEITTTPYYHPIFPLLMDTSFALRCMPKATLPPPMRNPGIAEAQLAGALASMERWTGRRPRGIWPAEGSVCPEMIPLLADAGVQWMATDDRVLMLSLYGLPKEQRDVSPHQPFAASFGGKRVSMVFRDHGLSDLISFTYSRMPAAQAVEDFLGHIRRIDEISKPGDRLVTVILDGENPWEFYPDSGREFLTTLFTALEREGIPTARVGEYIEAHPPTVTLDNLHTGSWIDANFRIWIGKPQKNQGWGYIKRTIDEVAEAVGPERRASDPQAARAFESLCAACGSDWFWWYDDDFDSAFKVDFDRIFRTHLKNVFVFLNRDIPLFLFEPIYRFTERGELAEPAGFMEPSIDGRRTSFFEWANALRYSVRGRGGAMALASEPFDTISFGFNTSACFVRIDPVDPESGFHLVEDDTLVVQLFDGGKKFKFGFRDDGGAIVLENLGHDGERLPEPAPVQWAQGAVLEFAVPFEPLGFKAGEKMTIAITIHRKGIEVRRYSHIHFFVPDETYEQRMWSV